MKQRTALTNAQFNNTLHDMVTSLLTNAYALYIYLHFILIPFKICEIDTIFLIIIVHLKVDVQ